MIGRTFGRWTVTSEAKPLRQYARWVCRCSCGTVREVDARNLLLGKTQSCGCLAREINSVVHKTHGLRHSRTYRCWLCMRERCERPTNNRYHRYGARGITVCERWLDFSLFLEDMGKCPSAEHSIDRIDNDGGYEPSNCRWATRLEQANNTRRSKFLTHGGKTLSYSQWARELGLKQGVIARRLLRGDSTERALRCP